MENAKTQNTNWNAQTAFDALALQALNDASAAKTASTAKGNSQKALSDLVLKVLANGTLKDQAHVRKSFEKGEKFNSLRMVKTRAQTVLNHLNTLENKEFSYTVGKGEKAETFNVSIAEIKATWKTDNALSFNVSTAYNYVKSLSSADITMTEEEQAIAAYLQASGISEKEFAVMIANDASLKTEAVAQGLTLVMEENKANLEKDAKFAEDEIFRLFANLPESKQKEIAARLAPRKATVSEDRKTA